MIGVDLPMLISGSTLVIGKDWGAVFDITDPVRMKQVATLPGLISVLSTRLGVVIEGGGLQVVDLSQPKAAVLAGTVPMWHVSGPFVMAGELAAFDVPGHGLVVVDPNHTDSETIPVVAESLGAGDTGIVGGDGARQVVVGYQESVTVEMRVTTTHSYRAIDLLLPTRPLQRAHVYLPGSARLTCGPLLVRGDRWFYTSHADTLAVWDISLPQTPKRVGGIARADPKILEGCLGAVSSGWAYVLNSTVAVENIADPEHPRQDGVLERKEYIERVAALGPFAVIVSVVLRPGGHEPFYDRTIEVLDMTDPVHPRSTDTLSVARDSQPDKLAIWVRGTSLYVLRHKLVAGRLSYGGTTAAVFDIDAGGKLRHRDNLLSLPCQVDDLRPYGDKLLVSTADCGLLVLSEPDEVWSVYLPVVSR